MVPIAVIGRKGSGMQEVLTSVILYLKERGCRTGVVKHLARQDAEIDQPEKDTYAFRMNGADKVILSGAKRYAVFENLDKEVSIEQNLAAFSGYDFVFFAGYFTEELPTVEIHRQETGAMLGKNMTNLAAIHTDISFEDCNKGNQSIFLCREPQALGAFLQHFAAVQKQAESIRCQIMQA